MDREPCVSPQSRNGYLIGETMTLCVRSCWRSELGEFDPLANALSEIERLRARNEQIGIENAGLRAIVSSPLAPDEMRLVDKHCDWIAFQHAWNAVMKGRREAIADEQSENGK